MKFEELKKRCLEMTKYKKPLNNERHFGIEFEAFFHFTKEDTKVIIMDYEDDYYDDDYSYSKIRNEGLVQIAKYAIKLGIDKYITIKDDGSLEPDWDDSGYFSIEMCVCVPESQLDFVLKALGKIFKKFKVNDTCGLHVHIDGRKIDPSKVFSNLVLFQDLIYDMNPEDRKHSEYCRKVLTTKLNANQYHWNAHYDAINSDALRQHQTIEVRIAEGSVNVKDVKRYTSLLKAIVDAKEITKFNTNIEDVSKLLKLDKETVSYVKSRLKKYKNERKWK